jgi:hypothetical protein
MTLFFEKNIKNIFYIFFFFNNFIDIAANYKKKNISFFTETEKNIINNRNLLFITNLCFFSSFIMAPDFYPNLIKNFQKRSYPSKIIGTTILTGLFLFELYRPIKIYDLCNKIKKEDEFKNPRYPSILIPILIGTIICYPYSKCFSKLLFFISKNFKYKI